MTFHMHALANNLARCRDARAVLSTRQPLVEGTIGSAEIATALASLQAAEEKLAAELARLKGGHASRYQ